MKRPRGRPPKQKPAPAEVDEEAGDAEPAAEASAPKKKRGRPRKDAAAA